jgi:hypothetical protein
MGDYLLNVMGEVRPDLEWTIAEKSDDNSYFDLRGDLTLSSGRLCKLCVVTDVIDDILHVKLFGKTTIRKLLVKIDNHDDIILAFKEIVNG